MARVEVAAPQKSRNYRNSVKRNAAAQIHEIPGLRERKKARFVSKLSRQPSESSANRATRKLASMTSSKFSKSASRLFSVISREGPVLRDVGKRGFDRGAPQIRTFHQGRYCRALASAVSRHGARSGSRPASMESGGAVGCDGSVRSPEVRGVEGVAISRLREILAQGQERGEITRAFPVVHLAEFMRPSTTRWSVSGPSTSQDPIN